MEDAFANMAKGLFSLMCPLSLIRGRVHRRVEAHAPSQEELLVVWLNELIFVRETEDLLFRFFAFTAFGEKHLEATCLGEPVDPGRHRLRMEVKAATYHRLSLDRDDSGVWRTRVILDV
jgi:SHS2 domain-containing protein